MMMMMIAIWHYLGQNRPQRRRSPEDGAGGMDGCTDGRTDGRTDGQIPPVFYRTSSPSGLLPKKEEENLGWGFWQRRNKKNSKRKKRVLNKEEKRAEKKEHVAQWQSVVSNTRCHDLHD